MPMQMEYKKDGYQAAFPWTKSCCHVEDFRTKKKKRNKGELRKYLVSENHEGIIDVKVFGQVQREIARRRGVFAMKHRKHKEADRLFNGMILCGDCGSLYQRKYTNRKKYDKAIWICQKYHRYGKVRCGISMRKTEHCMVNNPEITGVSGVGEIKNGRQLVLQTDVHRWYRHGDSNPGFRRERATS